MNTIDIKKNNVLGHPSGLFVLFFTEMWERFSYYGMRALLVIFLTASLTGDNPGWEWPRQNALSLLGTYALLVYLTPIVGGYIADKKIGYRYAVAIGALLMTIGHAAMAIETPIFLYIGLGFLILGNGFFKPNMTSIISKMYEGSDDKKDAAFTIYYMGVNAGAFLGIMLCGYLGEKISWSFGFGLAGIFMLLGMLQFWFAKPLFNGISDKPNPQIKTPDTTKISNEKLNPFTTVDFILIGIFTVFSLLWIFNDPLTTIGNMPILNFEVFGIDSANLIVSIAVLSFITLLFIRIPRYTKIVRDRMIAVVIFSILTVFFWASFEQAAGSLAIYAKDYTSRQLTGSTATIFKIIDAVVTIVPLLIISWVLYSLFSKTITKIKLSNIILAISFIMIWGIVIFKVQHEFYSNETEVPATWFGILNSLFIISFAPLFSKWWESKYNPSAAIKYGFGLVLLGLGFAFLVYGSTTIPQGAKTASVSMLWLVLAYLFHTLGELCLSPLGLSYISKLVPSRMIALMFGVYYIAIAIGNKTAHSLGGQIDQITEAYSMSQFFLIFTLIPIGLGLISMLLNPLLKKLMHGIR